MTALLVSIVIAAAQASAPAALSPHSAGAAKVVKTELGGIDLSNLKGRIRQLAWSPDGKELYLQTFDVNADATPKTYFHYRIELPKGSPKEMSSPPGWATAYLGWKSDKAAPGDPSMAIDLESTRKRMETTATPMAGSMAMGSGDGTAGGTSVESAAAAANQGQTVSVYTMRFKGEVIGEWINQPIVPGQTFGWGPQGSGVIAFADSPAGRVVIMDGKGDKLRVPDTKGALVPAWSADGTRLAWLESRGKNRYAVVVADVTW